MSTVRVGDASYNDKSKEIFENHFYEDGISKYQDNSVGSGLPQVADEIMSVEDSNVKDRLA